MRMVIRDLGASVARDHRNNSAVQDALAPASDALPHVTVANVLRDRSILSAKPWFPNEHQDKQSDVEIAAESAAGTVADAGLAPGHAKSRTVS